MKGALEPSLKRICSVPPVTAAIFVLTRDVLALVLANVSLQCRMQFLTEICKRFCIDNFTSVQQATIFEHITLTGQEEFKKGWVDAFPPLHTAIPLA
jgi:hypothetical protein